MTTAPSPAPKRYPVNRLLVGGIAVCCLCGAGGIFLVKGGDNGWDMWISAFVRSGTIMLALFVALPSRHKPAAWASFTPLQILGAVLAVAMLAWRPRVFVPVLAVLAVAGWFLRPRPGKAPVRPDRASWTDRDKK